MAGPSVCAIAIASTICGTARNMSETRISISLNQLLIVAGDEPDRHADQHRGCRATMAIRIVRRAPNSSRG